MRGRGWFAGVLWCLAVATRAQAQWGATQTIGNGGDVTRPEVHVAVDAAGNPTVAFAGVSTVMAVTGTSAGTWNAADPLGISSDGTVDLAVDPGSGAALVAFSAGTLIRTATRPQGGTWTIPSPGVEGTWLLPAGSQVSRVLTAISPSGQGVVAWELSAPSPAVQLVIQIGGTWSAVPETVPMNMLGRSSMVRDSGDDVLIGSDLGGLTIARRLLDGTYELFQPGPAEGTFDSLLADPVAGTFQAATYFNTSFEVLGGTILSSPPGDTTILRQVAAMRPPLDPAAHGAALAQRAGAIGNSSVAWLDAGASGVALMAGAFHEGLGSVANLTVDQVVNVAAGRTAGDDIVVPFNDSGAQPGVKSHARTPCAAGAWSATPVVLDAGIGFGPVAAAAGGNVAAAAWMGGNGQIRAAVFAGTPIPPGGLCSAQTCATAAAIPSFQAGTLSLVDVQGGGTLRTVSVGSGPYGIAVNPVDDSVWVTNRESDSVSVLTSGGNATATIATPKKPLGIVFEPTGTRAYVASYDDDQVAVVDAATRAVLQTVKVGSGPTGVAVTADGTQVWTANYGANTVSMIDLTQTPVKARTSRPLILRPLGIAVAPDGTRVYVSGFKSNRLLVIDPSHPRRVKRIRVGRRPTGVVLAPPPATRLYVANSRSGTVSVIDTVTNQTVGVIPTGPLPYGLSIDPSGRYLFVVESGSSSLLMWDLTVGAAVRRIAVPGGVPVGLGDFLLRADVCS